jgi:hypothetical protein
VLHNFLMLHQNGGVYVQHHVFLGSRVARVCIVCQAYTFGIWFFAECIVGHSAKHSLPSTTLDEIRLLATTSSTECETLGIDEHSVKSLLSSVKLSAKRDARQINKSIFCRVSFLTLGKVYFHFFLFSP